MTKLHNVDPAAARRHHCPLGIDDPALYCGNCPCRRVIFVEVDRPEKTHVLGKALFAFSRPAITRSRMISRSNWAKAATIVKKSLPEGVVVSIWFS